MKIPKAFHPILGVMTGFILFLAGFAILTLVFVGGVKAANYAAPYFAEVAQGFHLIIHRILSL